MRTRLLLLMALLLMTAGCSTAGNGSSTATDSPTSTSTTSTLVPLISAPPTTEAAPADPLTPDQAAAATWNRFISAAATRSGPDQITEFAADTAVQAAERAFSEPRLPVTFYTQVTIDGTIARIEDCILLSFPLIEFPYVPISGEAIGQDQRWQITKLEVQPAERCLPGDFAAEIFNAYENFWDNELVFSSPPDPDHQLIGRTLTGRRLQRKQAVLEWQVENNAELRGRPTTNPHIAEYQPGVVVLVDCQVPDPESGFYDMTTGERRPETPVVVPGRTDLVRTWLERDGEAWKVEFSAIEADAGCSGVPPETVIPIAGPVVRP